MTNAGRFIWNIDSKLLHAMLNARTGKVFISDVFEIAKLKWRIECCPNGDEAKSAGSFLVGLRLLTMPDQWKQIKLQQRAEIPQTNTSNTAIASCDREHLGWSWPPKRCLLSEVQAMRLQQMKIKISLKVIEIVATKADHVLFHHASRSLPYCIGSGSYSLRWTINEDMLKQFQTARTGKSFESKVDVVGFDPLMLLFCFPNGHSEKTKGQFDLRLQVINVAFPDISSMTISWHLTCTENSKLDVDGENTVRFDEWSAEDRNYTLTSGKSSELRPHSGNKLTLRLEYKVKAMYNDQNQEIHKSDWNAMINANKNEYDYERCFSLQFASWTCIKCQKQNKNIDLECIQCALQREYNSEEYLKRRSFEELEQKIAKYRDIPDLRELYMQSVVSKESDAFVYHTMHPSIQNARLLMKEAKQRAAANRVTGLDQADEKENSPNTRVDMDNVLSVNNTTHRFRSLPQKKDVVPNDQKSHRCFHEQTASRSKVAKNEDTEQKQPNPPPNPYELALLEEEQRRNSRVAHMVNNSTTHRFRSLPQKQDAATDPFQAAMDRIQSSLKKNQEYKKYKEEEKQPSSKQKAVND
eukprot:CAMPEP_0197020312 /NCGR_PEP_ID=MMETSP1384-20130603/1085_1 /TAXON_ID=29189 /ORGANISM="Ammonia sp." /LENGTH=581 /DNA_ID=CAMNT_0042447917 /DNA_START=34 /DNA_END=1776 /DNA_ORIENTATION=-